MYGKRKIASILTFFADALQPPIFKLYGSLLKVFLTEAGEIFKKGAISAVCVSRNLFQKILYIVKKLSIFRFCSLHNTVNDCRKFCSMNRIDPSANSSYALKHIRRKTGCSLAVRKGLTPVLESIH